VDALVYVLLTAKIAEAISFFEKCIDNLFWEYVGNPNFIITLSIYNFLNF